MPIRSALHLNGHVVPLIVERIAGHSGGIPFLTGVVPSVPFVPARNPALMSPDIGLAVDELIDVELKRLRGANVAGEKVYVVHKVVRVGVDAVVAVRPTLGREVPDQMVVPKYVGVCGFAPDRELHGFAAERGRTYALTR